MNRSTKTFLILLLIPILFSCKKEIKGPDKVPDAQALQKFDQYMVDFTGKLDIDKYCYAIVTNSNIIHLKENGLKSTDPFNTSGFSDLFLAVMSLQLEEENILNTDQSLDQYGIEGSKNKATIKSLLSYSYNTSGLAINLDPSNCLPVYQTLEKTSQTTLTDLFSTKIGGPLNMDQTTLTYDNNQITCSTTLNDLAGFSMAFDNQLLFESEDAYFKMTRPVYLKSGERCPSGLGCLIEINDQRKILGSAGIDRQYSTLMIKSVTDSVSLIMIAESPNLNAPFQLETGDMARTPVYQAFIGMLNDSTQMPLSLTAQEGELRKNIEEGIASGRRDEVCYNMISFIRIAGFMKDQTRLKELSEIYSEYFPKDIPADKLLSDPVALVEQARDYVSYKRQFKLDQDTTLMLLTTTEFTKELALNPWEYDNFELYFDLNHEKTSNFSSGNDDRQYRFNYDYDVISGSAPTFNDIQLAQIDVSPTRFNFEIAIPWNILFNSDSIIPVVNQKVGFDAAIADNDSQAREGSVAWNSHLNDQPWQNTSTYGTMIFSLAPGPVVDTICYAIKTTNTITLDGKDDEWKNVPRYQMDHEFMSGITGPEDQSGWFKVQWDDKNLYVFAEVTDDYKNKLPVSGDLGWITTDSEAKDTVWMVTPEICEHSGGDPANRYVKTDIPLTAGSYILHYQTNNSHSYKRWTRERPDITFYGIALYE